MKRFNNIRLQLVWAIVPVAVALSFLVGQVPEQWGLYSLYTTMATPTFPQPQTVFRAVLPQEESKTPPVPAVSVVEQTAAAGSILNQTEYSPNMARTAVPALKQGGPQVLIVHTHTCESYTPSEKHPYTPTDTDRTEDEKFNMIAVGREAKSVLEGMGISVLLDETVCDLPSYSGSYKKSLAVMEEHLKKHPSISVVLDLHRDAIMLEDGSKVKLTTAIEGQTVAQAMIVVGTDASGQSHPHWQENLAFANAVQQTAERLYPNLMRPINLRTGRFNQQASTGALLFEIGTSGNTLEEALLCARYVAESIGKTLKG